MRGLVLLVLVASALILSAASATPSDDRYTAQIEQTAREQQTDPTPAAAVRDQSRAAPTGTQTPAYTQNYSYPAPETWLTFFGQIATIVSSILLTIFTCGLWITSIWQWRAIKEQAQIAQTGADAATKSANVAEKQLRHAERAWIAFEVTELYGAEQIFDRIRKLQPVLRELEASPTVDIVQLRVRYRFNNCGRTPARLIAGSVEFICADSTILPIQPNYPMIPEMSESLLPPRNSEVNSLVVQLFPPGFEKFVRHQESLIIFGFVRYRDVIGEGDASIHETRFRMECHFPRGDLSLAGPLYFAFAGPESYNCYT
jgi:hypothetical protein